MGFHDTLGRFLGLAIVDIVGTFLATLILMYLLNQDYTFTGIIFFFIILLLIGELVHYYFNISTPFIEFLKKNTLLIKK